MTSAGGRLVFNAFAMNSVSHNHHGMWRHKDARQGRFNELGVWTDVVQTLERGRFDALFLADVVGVYGDYNGGWDIYLRGGGQIPNGDPAVLSAALISATEHLGLVFTSSIIQEHPFSFARKISTLDHLSGGRVGWNIVTNALENGARNFGHASLPEHDSRYEWAEEYVSVAYKLWEASWEDDAVIADRARGVYTEPHRVHAINHVGARYTVPGPHLSSPSPQRTPVLYQAGASPAGRAFAARHAEVQLIPGASPEHARELMAGVRAKAVNSGRCPEDLIFLQGLMLVPGSTKEEASRKNKEHLELLDTEVTIAATGSLMGVDFSAVGLDDPVDVVVEKVQGARGLTETMLRHSTWDRRPTLRDLARWHTSRMRVVGAPEQIADELERWAAAGIGGFNLRYDLLPGSFVDVVDHVMPVLRARGLAQREYTPGTLRHKLFGRGPYLPGRHPARRHRTVGARLDEAER